MIESIRARSWHQVIAIAPAAMLTACSSVETAPASTPAALADIVINGSRVYSESITSDRAGNIYVGSLPGTIYRATSGSPTAEPWIEPSTHNGLLSLFGVLADDRHGLLWTCSNPYPFGGGEPGRSTLKAFDLATGSYSANYDFPEGRLACNDIAVAPDGSIFASETFGGQIFRLAPHANELELFAAGEELVGIDGLAFAGDGTLYINNFSHNLFQRVERDANGAYAGLTTLALNLRLAGPDGLRPVGGNNFVQAESGSGRLALISVHGDSATVTPLNQALESSPAITIVGQTAYALEGKMRYLFNPDLKGQDPGIFRIHAFAFTPPN